MREWVGRIVPWLVGAVGALLISAGAALLLIPIVAIWLVMRGAIRRRRPPDAEVSELANRAFVGFFSVFVAAAVVFLLAGLAPAVARAFPAVHDALHRWAGAAVEEQSRIVAERNAFDIEQLTLPSGPATIRFTNLDVGVRHNVAIYAGLATAKEAVFRGKVIRGTESIVYRFQAPPPGTYLLWCDVHPFMNGKVVVTAAPSTGAAPPGGPRGLAGRIAAASHGSGIAAETTGQAVVPAGQVAANYVFSAIMLLLAILLIRVRSRDPTARLLAIGMVGTAAVFNAQAHVAFEVIPSALTSSAHDTFHVVSGTAFLFGLLLFPDGVMVPRIAAAGSGRWVRWIVRVVLVFVAAVFGLALAGGFHGTSPGGYVAFFGIAIPVAGVISQAIRYRQAQEDRERQQARLLVWALAIPVGATVVAGGLIAGVHALQGTPQTNEGLTRTIFLVFPILFTIIPLTLVVVLLRYRLWDVERVVSRTLVFGILAAFISTVYVLIVVGAGSAIGTSGKQNLPLSILATAIVAVAFEPLRRRLQQLANVLVYGQRASPYQVVTEFSRRIAQSLSVDEVLPRMAEAAARGVGAERTKVQVFLPGGRTRSTSWPEGAPEGGYDRAVMVLHEGQRVGDIWVAKPPGEALTREEDELLEELASQAGAALRNVQLAAELQGRLDEISKQAEELRASRQRLVAAQDAAARRLERNLHDGAQQQLVAIAVTARLARTVAATDPARAEALLTQLGASAKEALDTIRDLARGIYPPLLADEGLVVALQAQIQKSSLPATIEASGVGRYPSEIEAAVYFCCLEAFQNVAKYAHASKVTVRLEGSDARLEFSVTDDGRGFDAARMPPGSGLQNMEDRLAALGGSLTVVSSPGRGTVVSASVAAVMPSPNGSG